MRHQGMLTSIPYVALGMGRNKGAASTVDAASYQTAMVSAGAPSAVELK